MPKIKRIEVGKMLRQAAKLNAEGRTLDAKVATETFREAIQVRLGHGDHIHLYSDDVEECINPAGKCWEGPRNVRSAR